MTAPDWETVRMSYGDGHSVRESCEKFRITPRAWQRAVARGDLPAPEIRALQPSEKRALIDRLFQREYSQAMIAAELGMSKSTVSYHARRFGIPVEDAFARR